MDGRPHCLELMDALSSNACIYCVTVINNSLVDGRWLMERVLMSYIVVGEWTDRPTSWPVELTPLANVVHGALDREVHGQAGVITIMFAQLLQMDLFQRNHLIKSSNYINNQVHGTIT